jgi:adenylate kinase
MPLEKFPILTIISPPGGGKGTQTELLEGKLGFGTASMGNLVRNRIKTDSRFRRKVSEAVGRGGFVSDRTIRNMFKKHVQGLIKSDPGLALALKKTKGTAPSGSKGPKPKIKGLLLDGIPRNPKQARIVDSVLTELGFPKSRAVHLDVDEGLLFKRVTGRSQCTTCGRTYHAEYNPPTDGTTCDHCGSVLVSRHDDHPDVFPQRLAKYKSDTAPTLEHYRSQGSLITIRDTGQGIDKIHQAMLKALK